MALPYMGSLISHKTMPVRKAFSVLTPLAITRIEKKAWFRARPWLSGPIQTAICGAILLFSTPLCCAIFPQKAAATVSSLEPQLRERLEKLSDPPRLVYYNKGL